MSETRTPALTHARSLRRKLGDHLKSGDYEAAASVERELVERALELAVIGGRDYRDVCQMALNVTKLKFPRWG